MKKGKLETHHFNGVVIYIEKELVFPDQSSIWVIPFSNECIAIVLAMNKDTELTHKYIPESLEITW